MIKIVSPRSFRSRRLGHGLFVLGLVSLLTLPPVACAAGWLGVSVQDVTPELQEALELSVPSGALVSDVVSGSPADEAGIEPSDVILRVDDTPVEDADDLIAAVRDQEPGETVELTLSREDRRLHLPVTLAERAEEETEFRWFGRSLPQLVDPLRRLTTRRSGPRLGVEVASINRDLAPYFDAEPGRGLLVLSVREGSVAKDAGIRAGDILLQFNGERLSEPDDLREAVGDLEVGDRWEMRTLRKGREMEILGEIEAGDLDSQPPQRFFQWHEREDTDQDEPQVRKLERQVDRLEERLRKLEKELRRLDRR